MDLVEGKGGCGPLKLVSRARGIIGHSTEDLRGEDYWLAVNALREMGYDIPCFTGRDGLHRDGLRLSEQPKDDDEVWRQVFRAVRADARR